MQMIRIEAYLDIVAGTDGSSNGWHVVPPMCTKVSRFRVRCNFTSGAFTFIPTKGPGDGNAEAGVSGCGQSGVSTNQAYPAGGGASALVPTPPNEGHTGADDTAGWLDDQSPAESPGVPTGSAVCEEEVNAQAAYHNSWDCVLIGRVQAPEVLPTNRLRGYATPFCTYASPSVSATLHVCLERAVFVGTDKLDYDLMPTTCKIRRYTSAQMGNMAQSTLLRRCKSSGRRIYRTAAKLVIRGPGHGQLTHRSPPREVACAI